MAYSQTCPRCGKDFTGVDLETVVDAVVQHAIADHGNQLDPHIVRAHLTGRHPFDDDDSPTPD